MDDGQEKTPYGVGMMFIRRPGESDYFLNPDPFTFWTLCDTIIRRGEDGAAALMLLGIEAVKVGKPTPEDERAVRAVVERAVFSIKEQWPNVEEFALFHTYVMLTLGDFSRDDAARTASDILRKTVTSEAWRKRLDRWVEEKGHQKVDLRKHRNNERTNKRRLSAQNDERTK
ncbi:MAG: hypothetical protein M3R24_00845 [Chloroflexota bacterium]|nr:hypothetical protein [Chloroflexota bacterium]